jgi:hypothetical protein
MSVPFTFTSANTVVLVNDKSLSGIFKIDVYDESDKGICNVMLQRHIIGTDELVNEMRMGGGFSFKLLNNSSSAGYVAETAKVKSFHMVLSKEDDGKELLLVQTIVVSTSSFLYADDARSAGMKATEEEDLKNLISILKENQAKSNVNRAVLPTEEVAVNDDELVWLNAKDPEQLKDLKPRKLKKNKNKRA